jgi:hypothetical protein
VSYPERVAAKAVEVKLARVLLSVLAAPFYVLGWVVALLVVVVMWCVAAVQVGFADGRRR